MERTKQSAEPLSASPLPAPPRRISTAGYWIAAVVALSAVAAGVTWGIVSFVDLRHDIDGFARTEIPGQVDVRLPGSTGQVLYYEGPGAPAVSMLELSVTGPTGAEATVREYSGTVEYHAPGGGTGRAVATFDSSQPGSYAVRSGASLGTDAVLAVGSSIVSGAGGRVAAWAVLAVAGLVLAAGIAIVTAVRRSGPSRVAIDRKGGPR
jgi:hypothetical protein